MQITEALKHNVNTWDTGFWCCELQAAFSVLSLLYLFRVTDYQDHVVVRRAPCGEHVHPRAHDAAQTPVILRTCELLPLLLLREMATTDQCSSACKTE